MQSNLLPTLKQIQALPSFLLSQREKLPSISAIYCVLQGEKVLYIGQTKNLNQRWRSHHRDPELKIIPNARLVWLPCPVEKLNELESQMIETLKPALNSTKVKSAGLSKRVNVTLPDQYYEELARRADREGRRLANLAAFLLERVLREEMEKEISRRTSQEESKSRRDRASDKTAIL